MMKAINHFTKKYCLKKHIYRCRSNLDGYG